MNAEHSDCERLPFSNIDWSGGKIRLSFEGINFLERDFPGAVSAARKNISLSSVFQKNNLPIFFYFLFFPEITMKR